MVEVEGRGQHCGGGRHISYLYTHDTLATSRRSGEVAEGMFTHYSGFIVVAAIAHLRSLW